MDRLNVGFEVKINAADDGTFYGYGSVFGNVDDGGDIVAAGAFKQSLEKARKGDQPWPAMLLQHGGDSVEDKMPVGIWTDLDEDSKGLVAHGKLALKTSRGADAYELMKLEPRPALNGLSIGYRTRDFELHHGKANNKARRTLKAVDLHEISLVTFPMNRLATVTAVKAASEIKTIREFEKFLRDVGGFSPAAATSIASIGFKDATSTLRDEDDDGEKHQAALRALVKLFNPEKDI